MKNVVMFNAFVHYIGMKQYEKNSVIITFEKVVTILVTQV